MHTHSEAWWEMDNAQAQKHGPPSVSPQERLFVPYDGWHGWLTLSSIPTQQPICWVCVVTLLIKHTFSLLCVRCHSLMSSLVQGNAVLDCVCACVEVMDVCYIPRICDSNISVYVYVQMFACSLLHVWYVCIPRTCDCQNESNMFDFEPELCMTPARPQFPLTAEIIISSQVLPSSDLKKELLLAEKNS